MLSFTVPFDCHKLVRGPQDASHPHAATMPPTICKPMNLAPRILWGTRLPCSRGTPLIGGLGVRRHGRTLLLGSTQLLTPQRFIRELKCLKELEADLRI